MDKKTKTEFSKLHVVFADCLVAFVYITNFLLAWFDKQTVPDIAISIVSIYGAFATGGYFTLQAVRNTSVNRLEAAKHKYMKNGGIEEDEN